MRHTGENRADFQALMPRIICMGGAIKLKGKNSFLMGYFMEGPFFNGKSF